MSTICKSAVVVMMTALWMLPSPVVGAAPEAAADPRDDGIPVEEQARLDTCRGYETERSELYRDGIADDMAKGPEWAKQTLPAERLRKILRYIHLDEQVRFRCADVFATAAVREAERRARIAAARQLAAQRAWEAKQAEMLKNIPPPEPGPFRTASRAGASASGTPPLPVRLRR